MRTILTVGLTLALASSDSAQEPATVWNVDADRAPYSLFEMEAQEGTWVSVDVSPDGERLVFDLLGHLYEMDVDGGERTDQ